MTIHHKNLADGRWAQMTLCEQMANIGSEISRALNWKNKNRYEISIKAVNRALELLDLSMASKHPLHRLKEIARIREAVVDYFYGENQFGSSEKLWRKYFDHFAYAARKNH